MLCRTSLPRFFLCLAVTTLVFVTAMTPSSAFCDDDRRDSARAKERNQRVDDHDARPRGKGPRAKLRVKASERGKEDLKWISLDARKSKKKRSRLVGFAFSVRNLETGRLLPGLGESPERFVQVLLPAGEYEAEVRVRDARGRTDERRRKFKVKGPRPARAPLSSVEWSLGRARGPKRISFPFQRTPGLVSLGVVEALLGSRQEPLLLGSSGGCGGRLNNGANGIGIVTGVMGIASFATPEYKVAKRTTKGILSSSSAGMKIAGGNKSGACTQAKIDAINEQLQYQEAQIQDLYTIIARDEEAFFFALKQVESEIGAIEQDLFSTRVGNIKALLDRFMVDGALWNGETFAPWTVGSGDVLPLELLSIAACDLESSACCAGALDPQSLACTNDNVSGGPLRALNEIVPANFGDDLKQVLGSTLTNTGCGYDCWKNVSAVTASDSSLLQIYESLAGRVFDAVILCTAEDPRVRALCPNVAQEPGDPTWAPPSGPCSDDDASGCGTAPAGLVSNDVVALFDQYNSALGSYYLQAVVALNKAYSIEQLVNLYNYNRYVGGRCSSGAVGAEATPECLALQGDGVRFESIQSYGGVPGTRYHFDMLNGCNGAAPVTDQDHANAFNCAQTQLGLLYVQRLNVLYQHTMNFTLTDGPVGPQQYPDSRVAFSNGGLADLADALRTWNEGVEGDGLGAAFNYEEQLGRALPPLMQGARTPLDLLKRAQGTQTNSKLGYNWTDSSVIYQAYQVADAATCINTLLEYGASGQPDTALENVYTRYEDCPSIFALPDGTALDEGFYDGVTVQPYTFQTAPEGPDTCPLTCQTCEAGLATDAALVVPGGRGMVPVGGVPTCLGYCSADNSCGDYRFANGSYTDCTACGRALPSADWQSISGTNGSWSGSCATSTAILQEQNGIPSLEAECTRIDQTSITSGPVLCSSARWVNNNGTLFCEAGDGDPALNLSLSAPMGGNLRQCETFVLDDEKDALGNEGDTPLICSGEVYYGKRYLESLAGTDLVSPGSGTEATLVQMTTDASYLVASVSSSFDCTNDFFGEDPAPGFFKQCYCVEGNQLTWTRPAATASSSTFATDSREYPSLQSGLSYLTCGNFKGVDGPRVAYEYGATDGGHTGDDNDSPPTVYQSEFTSSSATFEKDIGLRSSDNTQAIGVNYEVAFVNVETDCTTQDNIQLDVWSFAALNRDAECKISADHGTPTFTGDDQWAAEGADGVRTGPPCVTAEFPRITNSNNNRSGFLSLVFNLPNPTDSSFFSVSGRRTYIDDLSPNGPQISLDVVMQCSDDGANECADQSSCLHMVTFKDKDWSTASEPQRAEVLAKRGFICQTLRSEPVYNAQGLSAPASIPLAATQAIMDCELSDGRVYRVQMNGHVEGHGLASDNRAEFTVSEILYGGSGPPRIGD